MKIATFNIILLSFFTLPSCDFKSSKDYNLEANSLEKKGKYKEAISLLNKAIEKDDKTSTQCLTGYCLLHMDSLQKALVDFNFSIESNFALPESYCYRGIIYIEANMISEGCKDLIKAQELGYPDSQGIIDKNCN
jgi:tetratricopeptide (TPR) repeat protein